MLPHKKMLFLQSSLESGNIQKVMVVDCSLLPTKREQAELHQAHLIQTQLVVNQIIQMRRQNSQTQYQQARKIVKTSVEARPNTKPKKSKVPSTQEPEHRPDKFPHKPIFQSELKTKTKHTNQSLVEKLSLLQKMAERWVQKEHRRYMSELVKLVIKQENIRSMMHSNDRTSRQHIKEYTDLLQHISQKQDLIIHQAQLALATPTHLHSATKHHLIAREMSPSLKGEMLGEAEGRRGLDKKRDDYCEELRLKDRVIKRLFQRVEQLERDSRSFDVNRSFGENINELSSKLELSHKNAQKIKELQQISSQQVQQYKELDHTSKTQIQGYQIDYNKLCEDYTRLEKRFIELEGQFKFVLLEKEDWQRKCSKLQKEAKTNALLFEQEIRAKLEQVLKCGVIQLQDALSCIKEDLKEGLERLRDISTNEVMELGCLFNKVLEQQRVKGIEWSQRYQNLGLLLQRSRNGLLECEDVNQQLIYNQKPIISSNRVLVSNLVSYFVNPKPTLKCLQIHSGSISLQLASIQKMSKQTQKDHRWSSLSFNHLQDLVLCCQKATNSTQVQTDLFEQLHAIKHMGPQLGCQTQAKVQTCKNSMFDQNQITKLTSSFAQCDCSQNVQSSTMTDSRNLQMCLNAYSLFWQPSKTTVQKQQFLQERNNSQMTLSHKRKFTNAEIQTQGNHQQPSFCQNLQLKDHSEIQHCFEDCDILKMLSDAEQCIMVPQIAILQQQGLHLHQEIQKLRAIVRQYEKQKEEQNVFNFRL